MKDQLTITNLVFEKIFTLFPKEIGKIEKMLFVSLLKIEKPLAFIKTDLNRKP